MRRLTGICGRLQFYVQKSDQFPVNLREIDVLSRFFRKPELLNEIVHDFALHSSINLRPADNSTVMRAMGNAACILGELHQLRLQLSEVVGLNQTYGDSRV